MHGVLLAAGIVASLIVAVGIVLEEPKWSIANVLVIGGVAIEAVCTLLLFGFDEGISEVQQSKIISLETRIAPRLMTLDECRDVSLAMIPFTGKTVRVQSYSLDAEGSNLAAEIIVCLEGGKTVTVEHALSSIVPLGGFGSGVFVDGSDKDLVSAIHDALGTKANLTMSPGSGWFSGNIENGRPEVPPDANVVVGIKPIPTMRIE